MEIFTKLSIGLIWTLFWLAMSLICPIILYSLYGVIGPTTPVVKALTICGLLFVGAGPTIMLALVSLGLWAKGIAEFFER